MKNFFASELATNIGVLVARLAVGMQLVMAGYAHFDQGVSRFASSNAPNVPRWIGSDAATGYSSCLPFLEMAAGGMLVLGITTRLGGLLSAIIATVVLAAHRFNFTDSHLPVYVAVSILLLCLGGGRFTIDRLIPRPKRSEHPGGAM